MCQTLCFFTGPPFRVELVGNVGLRQALGGFARFAFNLDSCLGLFACLAFGLDALLDFQARRRFHGYARFGRFARFTLDVGLRLGFSLP